MKVVRVPIGNLNVAAYNPRVDLRPGDPVYENLKRSIETFGYLQPIIVNRRNNTVVGGHQRLKVLKDLGYERVDVVFVDLSPEHEKALNLTLNKTVGEWDEPKLAGLLQDFEGLPDFDVQLTGFDTEEIRDLVSRGCWIGESFGRTQTARTWMLPADWLRGSARRSCRRTCARQRPSMS